MDVAEEKMLTLNLEIEKINEHKNKEYERLLATESKLKEVEKDLDSARDDKDRAEKELYTFQNKVSKQETQLETFRRQITQLREQLDAANKKILEGQEQFIQIESKSAQHEKFGETLNAIIGRKDKAIDDLNNRVRQVQDELDKTKRQLNRDSATYDVLKTEKEELLKRIAILQGKLEDTEQEITALKQNRQELLRTVSTRDHNITIAETQLSSVSKERDHYKSDGVALREDCRKVKDELVNTKNSLVEKDRIINYQTKEIQDKANLIDSLNNSKIRLGDELTSLRRDLETTRASSQEKIRDLQGQVQQANIKASKLEVTVTNFDQTRSPQ